MKDDPREVDWAPNQIKALFAAVHELQSTVASIRSQQDFMIGEGHGEPFEVWCRRKINGLGRAVEVHTRLIEKSQERLDGLDDRVSGMTPYVELESRVSALEGYPRRITPGLRRMSEPDDGPSFQDDITGIDPHDGPDTYPTIRTQCPGVPHRGHTKPGTQCPIEKEAKRLGLRDDVSMSRGVEDDDPGCLDHGKGCGGWPGHNPVTQDHVCSTGCTPGHGPVQPKVQETSEQIAERRRVLVDSMKDRRVTFDPEHSVLPDWAAHLVEVRVRHYLESNAPWSIDGVVRALRGELTFLDRRDVNEKMGPVKTSECPANTNRGQGPHSCWAWGRQHYHDKVGVVHVTDR